MTSTPDTNPAVADGNAAAPDDTAAPPAAARGLSRRRLLQAVGIGGAAATVGALAADIVPHTTPAFANPGAAGVPVVRDLAPADRALRVPPTADRPSSVTALDNGSEATCALPPSVPADADTGSAGPAPLADRVTALGDATPPAPGDSHYTPPTINSGAPTTAPAPSSNGIPETDAFAVHMLRRTTFGITPDLLADVKAAGGNYAWLAAQLNPASITDTVADQAAARYPDYLLDPPQVVNLSLSRRYAIAKALPCVSIARQLWSKRQLYEVMVDFWSNHLNTTLLLKFVISNKALDDRTVIRANALGRFEDMLLASSKSPAMMKYLNNDESTKDAPNENYGREFLELHTVGVDAGYGQDGVVNSARIFTGSTVSPSLPSFPADNAGLFRYAPAMHWTGPVRVLDFTHDNSTADGGRDVADAYVRHMANHPATARRIATKLAIRFVADQPPSCLIDRLTEVYLRSGTAIVPVLWELFTSPEFAASVGKKYQRPHEDITATVRALGIQPDLTAAPVTDVTPEFVWGIWVASKACGNAPLAWAPPNGYPDVAPAWSAPGSVLARWNAHQKIAYTTATVGANVIVPDWPAYLLGSNLPTTARDLADRLINRLIIGQTVSDDIRQAFADLITSEWVNRGGTLNPNVYNHGFSMLIAVALDIPHWSVR